MQDGTDISLAEVTVACMSIESVVVSLWSDVRHAILRRGVVGCAVALKGFLPANISGYHIKGVVTSL